MARHSADEFQPSAHGMTPGQAALERAKVLLDQCRWDLALQQLNDALAYDPEDGRVYALRAWCFCGTDRLDDAEKSAREALRLAPDLPFAHQAMGETRFRQGWPEHAIKSANEGLKLAPYDADLHALIAIAHLALQKWKKARVAAEQALALDPYQLRAGNVRAAALRNMGRYREANEALATLLALHPTAASAHTSKGWHSLHGGHHEEALEYFQEALRINPQSRLAREGALEVLRARNRLYRFLLWFGLWVERRGSRMAGVVVLVAWLSLDLLAGNHDLLGGMTYLIGAATAVPALMVLMPWMFRSLFNLFVLLNPRARFVLSEEEVRLAKRSIALFLAGAVVAGTGAATGMMRLLCLGILTMALPLALTGVCSIRRDTTGRKFMRGLFVLTVGLIVLGTVAPNPLGGILLIWAGAGILLGVLGTILAIRRYGRA